MFLNLHTKLFLEKMILYKEEVMARNYKSFDSFAIMGVIISLLVMLYGMLMSHIVTFNTEFIMMFVYFILMFLYARLVLKKNKSHVTITFYFALTPLMLLGILMGTFYDPTQPSITIMVFICVLPIFILDEPWRVILYITVTACVYTICCFIAKDVAMFEADMIDLILFYFLSIGVNCFSLDDRISSVENFVKYREKSEIDILTRIYNRGTGVEKIEMLLKKDTYGALLVLDIDNFKKINDNYGHQIGDEVLCAVSSMKSVLKT